MGIESRCVARVQRCCEDQTDDETEGVWLPFPAGLAPLPHLITNEAFV